MFFRKLGVTVKGLGFSLPVLVRSQTDCTAPLPPLLGTLLGRGVEVTPPPLFWGWEIQKIMFRRRMGSGRAVRGQTY